MRLYDIDRTKRSGYISTEHPPLPLPTSPISSHFYSLASSFSPFHFSLFSRFHSVSVSIIMLCYLVLCMHKKYNMHLQRQCLEMATETSKCVLCHGINIIDSITTLNSRSHIPTFLVKKRARRHTTFISINK